jgi:GDPmannose 4,6-dehydratase
MSAPVALIVGISGQDGAYLTRLLLGRGYTVHGTSRDAEMASFAGLEALGLKDRVTLHSVAPTDMRSLWQVIDSIRPNEIYNLSGQSSVGLSFQQPLETFESIVKATLNILETIRALDRGIRFYNAASGECFGGGSDGGAHEGAPFRPRSPYGVAKSAAYWAVANYRESYGLHACSGVLFNHESPLRAARFVTRKIAAAVARIANGSNETLTLGDVSVRRDWGWAPEYVEAMWAMLQLPEPQDFVIATGRDHSLEDFADAAFRAAGLNWRDHARVDKALFRPSEIQLSSGDASRAAESFGWRARMPLAEIAAKMVSAELCRHRGQVLTEAELL